VSAAGADLELVATVPEGWSVLAAGDARVDVTASTVTWALGPLDAADRPARELRLRAPETGPPGSPAVEAKIEGLLRSADGEMDRADSTILVAPRLVVEHVVLADVDRPGHEPAAYLEPGEDLTGLARFDAIRVRFQVRNADLLETSLLPRLQYEAADGEFRDVPIGGSRDGVPFYIDAEWRRVDGGSGTLPGPAREPIAADSLRIDDTDNLEQAPVDGVRLMGQKEPPRVTLPADSYTEIEFAVRVSPDIDAREVVRLRLVDAVGAIEGATVATVRAARSVGQPLSPRQLEGIPVGPPLDVKPAGIGDVDYPLVAAVTAAAWPETSAEPRYRLAAAVPGETTPRYQLAAPFMSPHEPDYSLVSDTCAACHRTHVAKGTPLVAGTAPQATMCFTCHDGSGSDLDVEARYADPTVPANDAGTPGTEPSAYYRHDAVTAATPPNVHSLTTSNEFEGVLNRHSECADCHNAHNATSSPSEHWSDGWSVSGAQSSTSGVAVTQGAARTAPAYTFLAGTVGAQPTREYEICLKCHSGFTTLPAQDPAFPSTWALDKGIEINPANGSYHPIAGAGTNTTTQMAFSLANSSPYKQWNFTTSGTVRCLHCHGDPSKFDAITPPDPGADLAPHASANRGILFQPYRDRELKGPTEPYDAADSALCLVCHAEEPFVDSNGTNTAFPRHDMHMTGMAGEGPGGTDIDTPGAGGGNAICAECHYRTHSTAQAYAAGDRSNTGLVNFAPNVQPNNGVLRYERTPGGGVTCTLVCHGERHGGGGGGGGGGG
jgi:predicted CXXCH cytochrome family protein